jgi:predicted metal-dependent hydrolase
MCGMFGWGRKKRSIRKKRPVSSLYIRHKEMARIAIVDRVAYFAPICGVTYKRIAIRDTRRSWGSCSSLGNLNFSYKLLFLPPCLSDYIIVHELCHRHELNHGEAFWKHVERILPDYKERKSALRTIEHMHGTGVAALQKVAAARVCYCHMEQ